MGLAITIRGNRPLLILLIRQQWLGLGLGLGLGLATLTLTLP